MTVAVVGGTLGIGLAAGLVWAARRAGDERRAYAVGLVVAAALYVAFALVGAAPVRWIGIEGLGLVAYGTCALFGLRGSARWVSLGWALHPAWDLGLHLSGLGAVYVPAWYVWACLTFDLVLAGAAWRLASAESRAVAWV